jgi:hypothetical protein
MTITIEIPAQDEARVREAQAKQDRETLKSVLGEIAAGALLEPTPLDRAVAKLLGRTPEEKQHDREALDAAATPPRALAPGESALDAVFGKWPGKESDEQVRQALDDL